MLFLTGASSFTGSWITRALAEAGHTVTAAFTREGPGAYDADPAQAARLRAALDGCTPCWSAPFGSAPFLAQLRRSAAEVLCLHGARVGAGYQDADFPVNAAVAENTRNLDAVFDTFQSRGGRAVVLTHTTFGDDPAHPTHPHGPVSPYGRSKTLTLERMRAACAARGLPLAAFWIPNPFGPLEKGGFTAYLLRTWRAGEPAVIRTPDGIRDFLPVDAMARAYAKAVEAVKVADAPTYADIRPSGYAESCLAFARRLAGHAEAAWNRPCVVQPGSPPPGFNEPAVVTNTTPVHEWVPDWREEDFFRDYLASGDDQP